MTYDPIPPYVVRVTFGVQYAREPHPTLTWAHPNGWLEVEVTGAPDEETAEMEAEASIYRLTGGVYAFSYTPKQWAAMADDIPGWHPLGVLARYHIDLRTTVRRFEAFREFAPRMIDTSGA